MNWTEINTEKYYRKKVGHSTSEIRRISTETPTSNCKIRHKTGEPTHKTYTKMLLAASTSLPCTAVTRITDQNVRFWKENLEIKNGK